MKRLLGKGVTGGKGEGWQGGVAEGHEVKHLLERGKDAVRCALPRRTQQLRVCMPSILDAVALGPIRHGHTQVTEQGGEHGAWLGKAT